jgi:hypothetical protein
MNRARRILILGFVFATCAPASFAQERVTAPPPPAVVLTPDEMEVFLKTAKVVRQRRSGKGVTDPIRATFTDGRVTHEGQIQTVDQESTVFNAGRASEVNFKDTYRFNIGGYRLATLLGLKNVPMSVPRRIDNKDAAVTWWVDDVQFDETGRLKQPKILGPDPDRTSKQVQVMRVWDELIQNRDRNQGNILWTSDWTLWMIDHTRAFRLGKELLKPEQLTRCDRGLLEALRTLTLENMTKAMGGHRAEERDGGRADPARSHRQTLRRPYRGAWGGSSLILGASTVVDDVGSHDRQRFVRQIQSEQPALVDPDLERRRRVAGHCEVPPRHRARALCGVHRGGRSALCDCPCLQPWNEEDGQFRSGRCILQPRRQRLERTEHVVG